MGARHPKRLALRASVDSRGGRVSYLPLRGRFRSDVFAVDSWFATLRQAHEEIEQVVFILLGETSGDGVGHE